MSIRSRLATILAVAILVAPACGYLRDKEPWTATVIYSTAADGSLIVDPVVINADSNVGSVQVVNDTEERLGFSVPDLAVFEDVPAGLTVTVTVDEAKDGHTYAFVDHIPEPDRPLGTIVVEYLDEEFRR